jgi:hypothetical protein
MGIRTLQALGLAWEVKLARVRQPMVTDGDDPPIAGQAVA